MRKRSQGEWEVHMGKLFGDYESVIADEGTAGGADSFLAVSCKGNV